MNHRALLSVSFLVFAPAVLAIDCSSDEATRSATNGGKSSGGEASGGEANGGEANGGEANGGEASGGEANGGTAAQGGVAGATDSGAGGAIVTVPPDTSVPAQPWDWAGVIGSGQSLAVGEQGKPVVSATQPYGNLKLSTGTLAWPVDPASEILRMVPLIEPIGRLSTGYPSSWPTNIAGETPHTGMASQVTSMVMAANGGDYVGVHGEFGENGQCLTYLVKGAAVNGVNGRAYAATLIETQAIARLAQAAGKTYGVGAFIMTHGECDAGSATYEADLYKLLSDYNADIAAITGQTQKVQLIVSQQNSVGRFSTATQAQWQVGVNHPTEAVCSGPKYHLPYAADGIHLTAEGYRQLGEKYGQVYYERVVQGRNWQPLYPTSVERSGQVITVHFHVPVPPLAWETSLFSPPLPNSDQWKLGRGFEVRTPTALVTVTSVEIVGDSVRITCAEALPDAGVKVAYAMWGNPTAMTTPHQGTTHWGLLRDSDPFVGSVTGKPQPNYAVAFYMDVP
jgi:hypothetical protein